MKGLLDGDIVVFRCGFAAERTQWHLVWGPMYEVAPDGTKSERTEWRHIETFDRKNDALDALDKALPGKFSRVQGEDYDLWPEKMLEPLAHALQSVKTFINKTCEDLDLNPEFDLEVFLSDGRNYRHDIAVTRPYKGNRKADHRPTYEKEIRNYIRENFDTYVAENEEADDLMGIRATELGPDECMIITLDKDLDMIPGYHYNWVKQVGYTISEDAAMKNFHIQVMTGDSTDNIPGLPMIGPAKALKALHGAEKLDEQLEEVVRMYHTHSPKEDYIEYLKEQGDLVWIQRHKNERWSELLDSHWATQAAGTEVTEYTLEVD